MKICCLKLLYIIKNGFQSLLAKGKAMLLQNTMEIFIFKCRQSTHRRFWECSMWHVELAVLLIAIKPCLVPKNLFTSSKVDLVLQVRRTDNSHTLTQKKPCCYRTQTSNYSSMLNTFLKIYCMFKFQLWPSCCFCGLHISAFFLFVFPLLLNLQAVSDDKQQPEEVSKLPTHHLLWAKSWVAALLDAYSPAAERRDSAEPKKRS